jgi:hypothetical protein
MRELVHEFVAAPVRHLRCDMSKAGHSLGRDCFGVVFFLAFFASTSRSLYVSEQNVHV